MSNTEFIEMIKIGHENRIERTNSNDIRSLFFVVG